MDALGHAKQKRGQDTTQRATDMSMLTSILGRKHQQPPPQQQQQQKGSARTGTGTGAGTEAAAVEPVSIDIAEQGPLVDAITLAAFAAPAVGLPPFATASMDWKETPTAHVFMADLPGLRRDEVKVEVEEERLLRISGQRQRAAEEKGDRWHRVERSSDRFVRTVRLPPNANTDGAQAALQDGVLTVTVPKDNDRKAYGRLITITN